MYNKITWTKPGRKNPPWQKRTAPATTILLYSPGISLNTMLNGSDTATRGREGSSRTTKTTTAIDGLGKRIRHLPMTRFKEWGDDR